MYKKVLALIIVVAIVFIGCAKSTSDFGIFLDIDNSDLYSKCANYETVVIDAEYFTKQEISKLKEQGKKVFSYLNIGSIEDFRAYFDQFEPIIISNYQDWDGEYWVDVSNIQWQQHITEVIARDYAEKGIDGFFIDNCDIYYIKNTDEIYDGVKQILQTLKNKYNLDILINGGDAFVTRYCEETENEDAMIYGITQECVYTKINFDNNTFEKQTKETTDYYIDYIKSLPSNIKVILIEYTSSKTVKKEIIDICNSNDYTVYISNSINLD